MRSLFLVDCCFNSLTRLFVFSRYSTNTQTEKLTTHMFLNGNVGIHGGVGGGGGRGGAARGLYCEGCAD